MNTLVVLVGPTGIGKTDLSIALAKHLNSPIISSDSRQFYKELLIGTAPPTPQQLLEVQHYFIHSRSINEDYTSGKFEQDALALMAELFKTHNRLLMVGGSGLYIDAVCRGIDAIPSTHNELRNTIIARLENEGLHALQQELERLDPLTYQEIDINNPQRVMRALEVCITSGKRYSDLKQIKAKKRGFNIVKIGLNRDREELYQRINLRVDKMVEEGLLEEARSLYPQRNLNGLKTVGYKELFDYFDGAITFDKAVELIKRNSRRYAKRQLTWFARYNDIHWLHPDDLTGVIVAVDKHTSS
ncbi:MAG: tRNA (adenosine(37)-N6)-dimethylallyltransferase MiaA [Prevotellaceae bacterium]|jgi:tRNA dimethylallyltransferase|nr:tRNA (adenosine(37)-N6)-dimethylallyltransferase MiaA [Prevotellaceae bacterium]